MNGQRKYILLPSDPDQERFSAEDVVRGVSAASFRDRFDEGSVIEAAGEAIRYYAAGCSARHQTPLVVFDGDVIARGNRFDGNAVVGEWYGRLSPSLLQVEVERMAGALGRPVVNVARPGVFGSTGDHMQRRRPRESRLMDAALDGLKQRFGWTAVDLAGFSGGGHVVAVLLARRTDIRGAVIASGNVAVRHRLLTLGRVTDTTGYDDFVDPIDLVSTIAARPPARLLMLADRQDRIVAASSQLAFAETLRAAGGTVDLRFLTAADPAHHNLRQELFLAAAGLGAELEA